MKSSVSSEKDNTLREIDVDVDVVGGDGVEGHEVQCDDDDDDE